MILLIDLIFMKPSEERVDYDYQNLENHRSCVNQKNQKNHSSDDIPHCLLFFKHIRHIRAHKTLFQRLNTGFEKVYTFTRKEHIQVCPSIA